MMQGQENVYAEQTQIIEPITVDPPETEAVTAVTPTRPILGTVEILLYTVCTVSHNLLLTILTDCLNCCMNANPGRRIYHYYMNTGAHYIGIGCIVSQPVYLYTYDQ